MADALYAEIDLPRPDEDWWDGLEALAHSTRRVLLAHAWAVPLFSRRRRQPDPAPRLWQGDLNP